MAEKKISRPAEQGGQDVRLKGSVHTDVQEDNDRAKARAERVGREFARNSDQGKK